MLPDGTAFNIRATFLFRVLALLAVYFRSRGPRGNDVSVPLRQFYNSVAAGRVSVLR